MRLSWCEYAQVLYRFHAAPGRELPPATGRLRHENYDLNAVQRVNWALGHNRIDVVLHHDLRWPSVSERFNRSP